VRLVASRFVHSERLARVQHNFIRIAVRRLPWRVWPLPACDARRLLIGLEVLFDMKINASALFARDILVGRVDCADLALMLRFDEVPYSRRRNAGLLTFFHRTNYGKFEPVNNAIINFNKYCHWRGGSRYVLRYAEVCSVGRAFRLSVFAKIVYHDV
jgi:hypothetical protein